MHYFLQGLVLSNLAFIATRLPVQRGVTKTNTFFHFISFSCRCQVLADEGKAKAIAFDEIDKAPEEKARGITIATVSGSNITDETERVLCTLLMERL